MSSLKWHSVPIQCITPVLLGGFSCFIDLISITVGVITLFFVALINRTQKTIQSIQIKYQSEIIECVHLLQVNI